MAVLKCRKFTLLDAMILVAATAAGLAWFRVEYLSPFNNLDILGPFHRNKNWLYQAAERFMSCFEAIFPLGVSVTLAALLVRLKRPRPSLRRLTRQPGFIATSVVSALIVAKVLHIALMVAICKVVEDGFYPASYVIQRAGTLMVDDLAFLFRILGSSEGVAVASCWFLAILDRRWHREPGWIDQTGLTLGCYWIANSAVYTFVANYR